MWWDFFNLFALAQIQIMFSFMEFFSLQREIFILPALLIMNHIYDYKFRAIFMRAMSFWFCENKKFFHIPIFLHLIL